MSLINITSGINIKLEKVMIFSISILIKFFLPTLMIFVINFSQNIFILSMVKIQIFKHKYKHTQLDMFITKKCSACETSC